MGNVGIFKYIAYKQISNNNTIQKGGSPIVNPSITTTYTAALNPLASKRESGTYKALYQMLLIKMKESNKDLDDDDKKNIAILLNKFEVEENRMIFILKTFVNYVRYLAKHPHDKTPETHTHNKLTTLKPQPIMQQPYIIPGVTFNRRKYMEELNMIQTDITVRSGILLKTHNELFEKLQVYINPNTIRNPLNVLQQQLLPVANIVNPVIVRKQVIGPQVIKQVKRVVELVPTDPFQSSLDMAPSPFYQPSMVNPSVDSDKWIIR